MGDQGATVVQVGNNNEGQTARFREEESQRPMEAGASFEAPRIKSFESTGHQQNGKKVKANKIIRLCLRLCICLPVCLPVCAILMSCLNEHDFAVCISVGLSVHHLSVQVR